MADPSVLSLFENENTMIDDLGAIAENGFPPPHSIAGHMPTGGNISNTAGNGNSLHGTVNPHMTSQADPMLASMQSNTFPQIATPALHHQNASSSQISTPHSQKFHSFDDFDQFTSQKLHFIGDSTQTQDHGIISHFGQSSQHSGRSDSTFSQYSIQNNSAMQSQESQQQSGEISQSSIWPAQQTNPGNASYISDQRMPSYLTHHDYAMTSPQSRLSHFNDQSSSTNQGTTYLPNISSPPPTTQRLSHISISSPTHINVIPRPRNVTSNTSPSLTNNPSFSSQSLNNQDNLGNFSLSNNHQTPVRHYGFPEEIQRPQINLHSGQTLNSAQIQHFSFNQHQSIRPQPNNQNIHSSRNLNDNSQITHFSNQLSSNNPHYRPPFPHMSPTRHTPPPPLHTPECHPHPPTASQGNFNQSSLQQLEQMVVPHGNTKAATPTSNPFHPIMQSNSGSNTNVNIPVNQHNIPGPVSHSQMFNSQSEFTLHVSQANVVNVSTSNVSAPVSTTIIQSTNTINFEVQQIQQHLQQLYKMPQSPRTQQKIMEFQERLRILQQQNQQQHLEQQQVQLVNQILQKNQSQQNVPLQQARILQVTQTGQSTGPKQILIQLPVNMQLATENDTRVYCKSQELINHSQVAVSNQQITIVQQPVSHQHPSSITCLQKIPIQTFSNQVTSQQQSQTLQIQPQLQQQQVCTGSKLQQSSQQQQNTLLLSQSSHNQLQQQTADHSISMDDKERARLLKQQQQQEKANRIVMEAIAKAQAAGNTLLPKVVTPPPISVTLPATETPEDSKTSKEKKKIFKGIGSRSSKKSKKSATSSGGWKKIKPKRLPTITFSMKKKRKKGSLSEVSDMDATPPHSPHQDEAAVQRRSARNTKRKKYTDDFDINLSDDDNVDLSVDFTNISAADLQVPKSRQFFVENPNEEDAMIVEKILAYRMSLKQIDDGSEVEEYYVKYKNFSYLHCEWKTAEELGKDKRIHMKIKRFKQKKAHNNNFFELYDEPFNPDYVEVDRLLDISTTIDPITNDIITHYLVKWRALPYEDSTWELAEDVDTSKIEQFNRIRILPPKDEWEKKERPKASDWHKREKSRIYKGGNTLRYYQLEGVNWLLFSWYNRQNCILADEMGLGKTIQSISFLEEVSYHGIKGPHLVIAPLSTIANWQREFETWSNMNAIVYHGSTPSRNMIQEYEMYYKDERGFRIPGIYKFNALITTYEIIIADCLELREIPWRCVIIDEAHRLKNKNCKLLEGLKLLDMEHRVLLTGTPLQNNVEELFSLLNFLEPARFPSSEAFMQDFGELMSEAQVEKLQQLLKPMMLRRLKEDVEKNLAPKEETIVEVELTNIQKKYYRAILERNFAFLSKGSSNMPNLVNTMMELRKCCNHPYLITGAEEKILEEYRSQSGEVFGYSLQAMIRSAGKLVLIDKLLPKLKAGGHKVLIFSQMVRCLDILEDYMLQKGYLYERLDGKVRGDARQASIDRFSKPDSDKFVFLLCTRAGGLGINLTAADTVIIFDSDWNPQNDLQAQARCHRIGQEKAVKVYRLITRNSYEREMFDRASKKLGLDKAVLQSMSGNREAINTQQLSKKDIEDLLRRGAYGAIMDDDNEGDQFCEEDIDQILRRRTQVIQIESGTKGSTFAKASFVAEGNRTDIDINDPNFWQKWAKKADIQLVDSKNELIVTEPRRRQQTRRFGGDDSVLEMSDLESSSEDEENKKFSCRKSGRRKKSKDEDYEEDIPTGSWTRSECFKVEKNLLTYGWGRWSDILAHGRFKRKLIENDVESISRTMLRYCLKYYKGDEKIKGFIWDLITPVAEGEIKSYKNHSGLSAPVPRGRKGKKAKKESKHFIPDDWVNDKEDPEKLLRDDGYKKHLQRHSNKVLLRVRLLYYLKQEVIGDLAEKINQGIYASELNIIRTVAEGEPPCYWWDQDCDWSLLVGVYKHGYEKYNLMRRDPSLCFLSRCGPPDGLAVLAEENDEDNYGEDEKDCFFKLGKGDKDYGEDDDCLSPSSPAKEVPSIISFMPNESEMGKLPFPSPSDLNTRLRRIITGFQRNHKKQELKMAQKAKKLEKKERFEAAIRERELKKKEMQQRRWSRREEADFYRTVSTYGIDYNAKTDSYNWSTFRAIARLEKKYNETLTEHFRAFYAMCKRVCNRKLTEEEEQMPLLVEPITEERASRCLQRIELLNKIRQEILRHPQLDERLKLCQPSMELPEWWQCIIHDKDLLKGAAKHGLSRTDYHILHDPELSFKEILQSLPQNGINSFAQPLLINNNTQSSIDTQNGLLEEDIKDIGDKVEITDSNPSVKTWDKSVIKVIDDKETNNNSFKIEETLMNGTVQPHVENLSNYMKPDDDDEDDDDEEDLIDLKLESKESEDYDLMKERPFDNGPRAMDDTNLSYPNDDTASHHSFSLDMEGNEPTVAQLLAQSMHNLVRWPKDKILQIRLEHICHCIENNEWPVNRRFVHEPMFPSSVTNTPPPLTPDNTPKRETSTPMSEYGVLDGSDHHIPGDRLKVTLQRKRKRRKKVEIEAERAAKLQALLSHNITTLSNTEDSQAEDSTPPPPAHQNVSPRISVALHPNLTNSTSLFSGPNGFMNGTNSDIALDLQVKKRHKHRFEDDYEERKRRKKEKYRDKEDGKLRRRRKKYNHSSTTKMWTPTNLDPEARVPVMNIDDGTTLSGDEAPMHKDLAQWLNNHPNYSVIRPDLEDKYEEQDLHELVDKHHKRKPRIDPNKLNFEHLTGEENVSVINRHTGKKITGRKAPPLRYLSDWLQKNPAFDVDPKWASLVREKGNLPEQLRPRILSLSDRKKKFNSNVLSSNLLASGDITSFPTIPGLGTLSGLPGTNLLANFSGVKLPLDQSKNSTTAMYLPFGGLTNLGLGNPMFNLSNFGFAGLSVANSSVVNSSVDNKTKDDSSDIKSTSSGSTSVVTTTSSTVTTPSLPFIFPPSSLLYNPLFAQNYGNFSLPANMPTSFATLAQGGLVNGLRNGNSITPSSDDESIKSLGEYDEELDDAENDCHSEKNDHIDKSDKNHEFTLKKGINCSSIEDKKIVIETKSKISANSSDLSSEKITSNVHANS